MFRTLAATALAVGAGAALLTIGAPPEVVRIVLAGDIMLSRNIAAKIRQADPRA